MGSVLTFTTVGLRALAAALGDFFSGAFLPLAAGDFFLCFVFVFVFAAAAAVFFFFAAEEGRLGLTAASSPKDSRMFMLSVFSSLGTSLLLSSSPSEAGAAAFQGDRYSPTLRNAAGAGGAGGGARHGKIGGGTGVRRWRGCGDGPCGERETAPRAHQTCCSHFWRVDVEICESGKE